GELAVRKGACARKARRDVAGLAGSAVARLGLGTLAVFDRGALLDDEDRALVALVFEFERREDARRACAHDDGIVFHTVSSALPAISAAVVFCCFPQKPHGEFCGDLFTPSVLLPTFVGQQDSSLERAPKTRNFSGLPKKIMR